MLQLRKTTQPWNKIYWYTPHPKTKKDGKPVIKWTFYFAQRKDSLVRQEWTVCFKNSEAIQILTATYFAIQILQQYYLLTNHITAS